MSKGPATAAPIPISMAMTTPPSSNGLTIQLRPRSAIVCDAGSSGCLSRCIVLSIPSST